MREAFIPSPTSKAFEVCGAPKATKAKTNPNPAHLLITSNQLHTNGQTEEEVFPYPGINTIYLSLCCSIYDVQQSIKNYKTKKQETRKTY